MKYIIKLHRGAYYLGCERKIDDEKYAYEVDKKIAKRYSTRAKAEHTMNRLIRTCVNATNAEIEEIEE